MRSRRPRPKRSALNFRKELSTWANVEKAGETYAHGLSNVRAFRPAQPSQDSSDEELMLQLARGRQDALGPLYTRYVGLIFNLASQALDRAGAEEIVQEVFLAVWRRADSFDPERGAFRPWVLQIAHHRILN